MPNWAENDLTITGPDVQKVLTAIRSESDEDARILDFNRIIPYPQQYKELDQRSNEYQEKFLAIEKDDPDRQSKLEALAAEYGVEPGAPWIKDGYNSGGYEWTCDHWATKWNAAHAKLSLRIENARRQVRRQIKCEYCHTVHKTDEMTVMICKQCGSPLPDSQPVSALKEFDTAWSPPIPVIEKMASLFPDHEFDLQYFEGGMGAL